MELKTETGLSVNLPKWGRYWLKPSASHAGGRWHSIVAPDGKLGQSNRKKGTRLKSE